MARPLLAALALFALLQRAALLDKERIHCVGREYNVPQTSVYFFGPYQDGQQCTWVFKTYPQCNLIVEFLRLDIEENGDSCYDYLTTSVSPSQRICKKPAGVLEGGDRVEISFVSDGSQVRSGFEVRMIPTCDVPGDYWTIYTFPQLVQPSGGQMISHYNVSVKKHYLVIGENAGRSLSPNLRPISIIPYCSAEDMSSCEWEPYYLNIVPKMVHVWEFKYLKTKNKNLEMERVCLTVETNSANGPVALGLVHNNKEVTLKEAMLTGAGEVLRLEAELPLEYKWKPIQLFLNFQSQTNFGQIVRIAGCIPGKSMDYYQANMTEGEVNRAHQMHPKDPAAEGGNCEHSGRFNGSICVCRFGFSGPSCDTICGENRFGPNCEGECSGSSLGCLGKMFCKIGEGCACAVGYTGQTCSQNCAETGTYGVDCSKSCGSCLGACNIYTGECERGCKQGYVPPHCKEKWVHLVENRVTVEELNHTTARLTTRLGNGQFDGAGKHAYHSIQYKEEDSATWKEWSELLIGAENTIVVSGLKPGTAHRARTVLYTNSGQSYQNDDLPHISFSTTCSENPLNIIVDEVTARSIRLSWEGTSDDPGRCPSERQVVELSWCYAGNWDVYNGTGGSITVEGLAPGTVYSIRLTRPQPKLYYYTSATTLPIDAERVKRLRIVNIMKTKVELEWDSDPAFRYSYKLRFKCLRLMARLTEACENDEGSLEVEEGRALIDALHPFREYAVWLHDPTTNYNSTITFITQPTVPSVQARLVDLTTTNSSVTLSWGPPESCSGCNGILDHYEVILMEKDGKEIMRDGRGRMRDVEELYVGGLEPRRDYRFDLHLYNNVGHNASTVLSLDFTTKPAVPSAVCELEVYKKTRNSVGLRWAPPENSTGELGQFVVKAESLKLATSVTKEFKESSSYCSAWPGYYCATITGLKPDTLYNFTVSAVSIYIPDRGVESQVCAVTTESAPGAPLCLRVIEARENGITLEWQPPRHLNGNLRSFLVKVDQTESEQEEFCCQYYPKVEVTVRKEQPLYTTEVVGLEAGGSYAVSVMAETVWLGPPTRITGQTRPRRPTAAPRLTRADPHLLKWTVDTLKEGQTAASYRLLVVAENGMSGNDTAITNPDLREQLEEQIKKPFHYITMVQPGDEISLESGGVLEEVFWEGLMQDQEYSLALVAVSYFYGLHSVSAVNVNTPEKGSQRTVTAVTKESASGPPLNLKATRITEYGMKLDWEPPNSQSEESCCDVYPKVDVVVNNEQPVYSAEITHSDRFLDLELQSSQAVVNKLSAFFSSIHPGHF